MIPYHSLQKNKLKKNHQKPTQNPSREKNKKPWELMPQTNHPYKIVSNKYKIDSTILKNEIWKFNPTLHTKIWQEFINNISSVSLLWQ